jgi:hypothetical protein
MATQRILMKPGQKPIEVFIPTRGRRDNQITINELDCSKFKVWVVHEPEERPYDLPDHVESLVYHGGGGLSAKRDFIYAFAKDRDVICVQIDDDCRIYRREDGAGSYLQKQSDISELLCMIQLAVSEGYLHGGISQRAGNNREPANMKENAKVVCFMWHYGVDVFFGETFVMADYNTTLALLTSGYPNLVFFEWCCNQSSGYKGGCALYRTKEMVKQVAEYLEKKYPGIVTAEVKYTKGKGVFGGKRTDVRVQWKKAFKESR